MTRNCKIIIIASILVFSVLYLSGCAANDESKYKNAQSLLGKGQYSEAAEIFDSLGSYEDSTKLSMYAKAVIAAESGDYETAFSAFRLLEDLKDSKQLLVYYQGRRYQSSADSLIESKDRYDLVRAKNDYNQAAQVYSDLSLFKDCQTRLSTCQSGSENAQEKIRAHDYAAADALEQAGNFEEAMQAFIALGSYSDSAERVKAIPEKVNARDYAAADKLKQDGKYEEAIEAFTALGDYSDSKAQITETKYLMAKQLASKGDYAGAFSIFIGIKGYKDVDSLLATDENLLAAREAKLKPWKTVGGYVTFGTYPQTKAGTDTTPIEWLVLDVQGDKSLLISRYALDCQPYNPENKDITWEKCTLRTWLNSEFANKAFSANEQKAILMTQVDNSSSQGYSGYDTSGGNNTQDKIFLLSYAEAWQYFADNSSRKCAPTDYAVAQGGWTSPSERADGKATSWWWLRSPGSDQRSAACVRRDGSRGNCSVHDTDTVVRPAFWINLESVISSDL